jgi:hypothetical protein
MKKWSVQKVSCRIGRCYYIRIMNRYLPQVISSLVCLILFWIFRNDPIFGDAIASTYQAANHIYECNLSSIFYPTYADPGHPTLYAWMLAFFWSIFGKSLMVSHAYAIAWMLLIMYMVLAISKTINHPKAPYLILAFVTSFATFLSLSAAVINTTALMFFVLLAVYALLNKNNILLLLAMCAMVCTHLQGTFFVAALFCTLLWHRYSQQQLQYFIRSELSLFLLPAAIFSLWLFMHQQHTGWWLKSPHYADTHTAKSITTFFKSQLLIIWRILDYGMFAIHIFAIWAIIKGQAHKLLSKLYISFWVVNALLMGVFLQNTIGHRYFFAQHILGIVIATAYLISLKQPIQWRVFGLILACVISGNFWVYPGKTIGDATLAYRNYFKIEQQLLSEYTDSISFYSYTPIGNPPSHKYLQNIGLATARIPEAENVNHLSAIIQSNLNAEFTDSLIIYLQNNWYGKTYSQGAIYANVYLNPAFFDVSPANSQLRQPSWIELRIHKIKKYLKQ